MNKRKIYVFKEPKVVGTTKAQRSIIFQNLILKLCALTLTGGVMKFHILNNYKLE